MGVILLNFSRMSVPYTPPSRQFVPVEMVAKHAPNLGYQVYFANEKSTGDILNNVSALIVLEAQLLIFIAPIAREVPPHNLCSSRRQV